MRASLLRNCLVGSLIVVVAHGCQCAPVAVMNPDAGDGGTGPRLTIKRVDGALGSIRLGPTAEACDASCSLPVGVSLELTALADPGYDFQGWSGACADAGTSVTCALTVNENTNAVGTFTPFNFMFTSSAQIGAGMLGGRDGADSVCRALATDAGLPGTFHAFLRTAANGAGDVFLDAGARGWVRVDGRPFLDSMLDVEIDQLDPDQRGGRIFYPPRLDEHGNDVGEVVVFTGSGNNGAGEGDTCDDWSDVSAVPDAGGIHAGDSVGGTASWLYSFRVFNCSDTGQLYCLGSDYVAPIRPAAPTGRVAFLGPRFSPSAGLSAADQLCASAAADGGWAGSYRAFLATVGHAASERFDAGGSPWQRPDGVNVVLATADLFSQPPQWSATLQVTSSGEYLGRDAVWTGGPLPTLPDQTCSDWLDGGALGVIGDIGYASSGTLRAGTVPCDQPYLIYCFQE